MTPPGVMRPILFPKFSVNQRLPSGPAVMMRGLVSRVEGERVWYSPVTAPLVVMRPILSDNDSQNQRLPSGPAAIPRELLLAVGIGNSPVMTPLVVMRPILFAEAP